MIYFLFEISLFLAFLFIFLAGKFSAMQDSVKHYPLTSIFNIESMYNTKVKVFGYDTGIVYRYWYNINGLDYLGKYENYNNQNPKKKFKILGLNIHLVQITDAWHWWKMWRIVFDNLSDIFSSIASVCLFIILSISVKSPVAILYVILYLFTYFWAIGYIVNFGFNLYYDKKLRRD